MGRVARFKKLKAVDPFNRKRPRELEDEEVNQAPTSVDAHMQKLPRKLKDMKDVKAGKRRTRGEDTGENVPRKRAKTSQTTEEPPPAPHNPEKERRRKQLSELKLGENESLKTFNKRVDDSLRDNLNSTIHKSSDAGKKKRAKFLEHKQKQIDKRDAKKEAQYEAEAERRAQHEPIRFGEVAMAPPQLTVLPRKASTVSATKSKIPLMMQQQQGLMESNDLLKQQKAKLMEKSNASTASSAAILEQERARAIAAYRELKQARQRTSSH